MKFRFSVHTVSFPKMQGKIFITSGSFIDSKVTHANTGKHNVNMFTTLLTYIYNYR